MLQASHNKLGACCALMGKVASCKLRCVVLGCAYPSFLPTSARLLRLPSAVSTDYVTRLWRILRQPWNTPSKLGPSRATLGLSRFCSPIFLAGRKKKKRKRNAPPSRARGGCHEGIAYAQDEIRGWLGMPWQAARPTPQMTVSWNRL
ncbi:hypothetical protein KM043_005221 [Ampulex compressa]|nr:hypothetical protein KM043_005221 [Ampulex compressa]